MRWLHWLCWFLKKLGAIYKGNISFMHVSFRCRCRVCRKGTDEGILSSASRLEAAYNAERLGPGTTWHGMAWHGMSVGAIDDPLLRAF
jgi:hypothetical protein